MSAETLAFIASGIAELTRQATTPSGPWLYGRDLVCVDDLTATLAETDPTTTQSLAQDCFHRITTDTVPDDPDFGIDVRDWLSSAMTRDGLLLIGATCEGAIRRDDRVRDVTADVTGTYESIEIAISVTPADPSLERFTMIVAATSAEALLKEIR
jgi:hypothetical protein